MTRIRRGTAAVVAVCSAALLAGVAPTAGAAAVPGVAPALSSATAARAGSPVPPAPGRTQHALTADDVRALPQPSVAPGSSRATIARAFAVQNSRALGLTGDLGPARSLAAVGGGSVVRFDQTVGSVPVMGGQVVVDVSADGSVRGAMSETLPGPAPSTTPAIGASAAVSTARAVVARAQGGSAGLVVAPPSLTVFDADVLGVPGLPGATLAWRTEVTSTLRPDIRQLVVVDAARGGVLLSADLIAPGKSRTVCDAANVVGAGVPCTSPVRLEGGAATGQLDVDLAYEYAGATYDFYKNVLGRDSIDDAGMTIVSTVRYCENGSPCPLENAFWDGSQMLYGDGFAAADDVVGHELTHGVTEKTSGLFYFYESGAINESLSDIFGEFVDLSDGVGTDTAGTRWQMGEDLPASFGVIRDLRDPTLYGDPDRTNSPNFSSGSDSFGPVDGGGVHTNSGVGNKFAYLITDGDSFNGQTVAGLGIPKAARIIYGASQRLTSAADYRGLAAALKLSCSSLVGTGGITAGDCAQVDSAIAATAMDAIPPATLAAAPPPRCPADPGVIASVLWSDDLEDSGSGRWARTASSRWYYADEPNPYSAVGYVPRYATSGINNLWADDASGTSDSSMAMASDVVVHAGSYLRFNHAFAFDQDPSGRYDGGVVEYSTNGAAGPWNVMTAAKFPAVNGYTGVVSSYTGTTNILKGRDAFVGTSRGYRTTQIDVSQLAGASVRFRFRVASDASIGGYGWFVDDVSVGSCASPPRAPVITGVSTLSAVATVLFTALDSGLPTSYAATCTSTDGGATVTRTVTSMVPVPFTTLTSGRTYTCTVRATNALGSAVSQPSAPFTPVDNTTPVMTVPFLPAVTLTAPVFTATATDDGVVVGYVVNRSTAGPRTAMSAWSAPVTKPGRTLRWVEQFKPGTTVCVRIRAKDAAGNLSVPDVRCQTTPVDERSLTRSVGSSWVSATTASGYRSSISTSKRTGDSLVLTHVTGAQLVLLVRKSAGAGIVSVKVSGYPEVTVKTSATSTVWRAMVKLPVQTYIRDRTVTVKVSYPGSKGVTIDGVAVVNGR